MPPRGWRKPKPVVTAPPSPYKTRSGVIRQVKFSPQVDLQNDISSASVNLNKMPNIQRTPVGKSDHPLVNTETPRSTSASSVNSGDRTTRGSLRKQLAFTPAESVQNNGSVRGEEEALAEAIVLDSTYVRESIDNNEEPSSEEEGCSSVRQYEANISQAERTPFRQIMSETMTMSHEDIEHQQYIEALENSYSLSKEITAQRE